MSKFVRHEPCPVCRSAGHDRKGDNLGAYQDGSKYCFKCGHYESANKSLKLQSISQELIRIEDNNKSDRGAYLPPDFTFDLPEQVMSWLAQYELTEKEIDEHNLGWSESHESLIYPVFDVYGNLIMAQSRRFGNKHRTRFHTSGFPDAVFHIVGLETPYVVLVEDMISAIKVARVASVMPLWGSNISNHRAWVLSNRFRHVRYWLDNDKATYSIKRAFASGPLFDSAVAIVTEKDPKCYSTNEIKEILDGHRP